MIIDAALLPAGKEIAYEAVATLKQVTRPGDMDSAPPGSDDEDTRLTAYALRCARYPQDVLVSVCCCDPPEFFPSLKKLVEWLEVLTERRRQLKRALGVEAVDQAVQRVEAAARRYEEIQSYKAERERRFEEAAAWRAANSGFLSARVELSSSEHDRGPVTPADLRRVREETACFRLKGEDDPGVLKRLQDMRVEPAQEQPVTAGADPHPANPPAWPRVRHSAPRRARSR